MKNKRREFLKMTSLGIAGNGLLGALFANEVSRPTADLHSASKGQIPSHFGDPALNMIGAYGPWATSLTENRLPDFSFRKKNWTDIDSWRVAARKCLNDRLAVPSLGAIPQVTVHKTSSFEGLHIEEISWQLPYGRPTNAILLKPEGHVGRLPAILAFHDHGGNKYFGIRKITQTGAAMHPMMKDHQKEYYEGRAWANEIAKKGYVVLVSDAFPFASRRVMLADVPESLRDGLTDDNPEDPKNIQAYNNWAGQHEHTMAKSLFCAGTTWPGVFFAEDRIALDILCSRADVDAEKIGCAGLSGGGMRTVFMAGMDPRIKCAVCVGFMTTWKDFLLNKSYTHTWMTYVPLLPNELDFPEILGLRVPLPTLVLNDRDDELYTLPEMKRAEDMLSQIYTKANAANRFKCSFYPGPHKFDAAMQTEAFNWFDKWLKH